MTKELSFPGYRLEQEIGRGASSTVYLARQESLDREVALKVLSPALTRDDRFVQRFLKERKITARLNHPNVIKVYDFGVHEEHYFLVMELLTGGTLEERIQKKMPLDDALRITEELSLALAHAHYHGCVHRDLKPLNILFRHNSAAVLTDFGIAKTLDSLTKLTATGVMLGSPRYMSPEQIIGQPVDNRSDLYSLGVLFHQLLTGELPYDADNVFALASKHATAPLPILPSDLARFQPLLDKLLAKQPDDRFASVEPFLQALRETQQPSAVFAQPIAQPNSSLSRPQPQVSDLPDALLDRPIDDWQTDIPPIPIKQRPRTPSRFLSATGLSIGLAVIAVAASAAYLSLSPKLSKYDPFAAQPLAAMPAPSEPSATPYLESLLLPPALPPRPSALIDSARYQQPQTPVPANPLPPPAQFDDATRRQRQARLAAIQRILQQRSPEIRIATVDPAARLDTLAALQRTLPRHAEEVRIAAVDPVPQGDKLTALQQTVPQRPADIRIAAVDPVPQGDKLTALQQTVLRQSPLAIRISAIDPVPAGEKLAILQQTLQQRPSEIRVAPTDPAPHQQRLAALQQTPPPLDIRIAAIDPAAPQTAHPNRPIQPQRPQLPSPQQQRQRQIAALLTRAEQQVEARRWTIPADDNAYNSYQAVLALDANNEQAKQGLARLVAIYANLAERQLNAGVYNKSIIHAQRGLKISPRNDRLLALLETAESRAQNAERKRRAAQRRRPANNVGLANAKPSRDGLANQPDVDLVSNQSAVPVPQPPPPRNTQPRPRDKAESKKPRIIGTF